MNLLKPKVAPRGQTREEVRQELRTLPTTRPARSPNGKFVLTTPAVVIDAGQPAIDRFHKLFAAPIGKRNQRTLNSRTIHTFLAWCGEHGCKFDQIDSLLLTTYIERLLGDGMTESSVRAHLAAIRMMFDFMVSGDILPANPAASVFGPQPIVRNASPAALSSGEMDQLFRSIDTSTLVGLRDRALIALLAYTFSRVNAAVGMRMKDYYILEGQRWVRSREKDGTMTELPCHRTLSLYLDEWISQYGMKEELDAPMFPTLRYGKVASGQIFSLPAADVYGLIQRHAKTAGIQARIGAQSFRAE